MLPFSSAGFDSVRELSYRRFCELEADIWRHLHENSQKATWHPV